MAMQQIVDIISAGENEQIEFKTSFNKTVGECLVAFANAKGGKVLIGIDDSGSVVGTSTVKESLQKWINEIKQNTVPAIIPDAETVEIHNKNVVIMQVQEFPLKPIAFRGRYYRRVHNANHILSLTEINDLYTQSLQTSWDSYPYHGAAISDLDNEKIEHFIKTVNENNRFTLSGSQEDCLRKLKLIVDNRPSNAAMILFSRDNLLYNVHIGRFKTPSLIIDDRLINGTLYEVLDQTMRYIISQIKVAFEITGETSKRSEIPEYPLTALRELVLNALVHRDYKSPTDTQIKIFDQEITIFNPGKLYGGLTIEELKTDYYQAQTRNKLIAEAFYLTNDIEKYGSGYRRVREQIAKYPTMTFEFMEISGGYLAKLSYLEQKVTTHTPQVTPQDTPQVTPQVAQLLGVLKGEMSRDELQEQLKLKDREYFRKSYLIAAIELSLIVRTLPDKPNSKYQKYRLTQKGKDLKSKLIENQ